MSSFALDISGTVMDNNAYTGHGKTAEEVMQAAGMTDVAIQKNYMAVMSNSMSEEDFARLQAKGFNPGSEDIDTVVTIVDRIKTAVRQGGTEIIGYTDDVSPEALKEIIGSEKFASALADEMNRQEVSLTEDISRKLKEADKQVSELTSLSDGSIKYMLENNLEPTVQNLYTASFSATASADRQAKGYFLDQGGYYGQKAEEVQLDTLKPQLDKVIEEAGLDINEETQQAALWIVQKGIPLTADILDKYIELKELKLPPSEEEKAKAFVSAISSGRDPKLADLSDTRSDLDKAILYKEAFEEIDEKAYVALEDEQKVINLKNLQAQSKNGKEEKAPFSQSKDKDIANLSERERKAKLKLEQVRLKMTVEANYMLLQSGFSIDTAPIENLISALESAEDTISDRLFKTEIDGIENPLSLYEETNNKVSDIQGFPAGLSGLLVKEKLDNPKETNLNQVYDTGLSLKAEYEKAGREYETMQTQIRRDLGDSIKMAFRNLDDIILDNELPLTDENRRIMRILSYNSMDFTSELFDQVKLVDTTVQNVLDKMTPANVLKLIRKGVNPLDTDMDTLNKELDDIEEGSDRVEEAESYSKFLYKLEQRGDISDVEREAYIGIFRMKRQLEKTDYASIGSVVQSGKSIEFESFLQAIRSTKKQGMDYSVGDEFSAEGTVENSIDEQIRDAYRKIQKDLEKDSLEGYIKEQSKEAKALSNVDDTTLELLLESGENITLDHLLAAQKMRQDRGNAFRDVRDLQNKAGKSAEENSKALEKLLDSLEDKETFMEAYEDYIEDVEDTIEHEIYEEAGSFIDVRALNLVQKQVSLMGNMAKSESYEIPIELGGELTSIHLTIVSANGQPSVKLITENELTGKLSCEFNFDDNNVKGYVVSQKGTSIIEGALPKLSEEVRQATNRELSMTLVEEKAMKLEAFETTGNKSTESDKVEERTEISNKVLYQTAKLFLKALQSAE